MSPKPLHHSINYVELTVTDLDAAKAFYSKAFGCGNELGVWSER